MWSDPIPPFAGRKKCFFSPANGGIGSGHTRLTVASDEEYMATLCTWACPCALKKVDHFVLLVLEFRVLVGILLTVQYCHLSVKSVAAMLTAVSCSDVHSSQL